MDMKRVNPGDRVSARTAEGDWVTLRALGGAQPGQDFEIVWVCDEGAWEAAGPETDDRIPWPAAELRPLASGGDRDD
jgi:hypothetical protein